MELFQEYQGQKIDTKNFTKATPIGHGMIPKEYVIGFKELEKRVISLQFDWLMKNYFIEWLTQQ